MKPNPLVLQAIAGIVRAVLQVGAGWLVAHHAWSPADADKYVEALAVAVAAVIFSIGWSVYQKYRDRLKLVTALGTPARLTEHELEAKIASGETAPVSTRKDRVPRVA